MVGEIRKVFMKRIVEMDSTHGQNFSQQLGMWKRR